MKFSCSLSLRPPAARPQVSHLRGAIRAGATREEVASSLHHPPLYIHAHAHNPTHHKHTGTGTAAAATVAARRRAQRFTQTRSVCADRARSQGPCPRTGTVRVLEQAQAQSESNSLPHAARPPLPPSPPRSLVLWRVSRGAREPALKKKIAHCRPPPCPRAGRCSLPWSRSTWCGAMPRSSRSLQPLSSTYFSLSSLSLLYSSLSTILMQVACKTLAIR